MSNAKKKETIEVPAYEVMQWRVKQGFDTVKLHFFEGATHPDSKMRWTCKKHPMRHGTFWLSCNEVTEAEDKGLSACPCCRALEVPAEEEVVDFQTFKKDVAEQRKSQGKLDKKQDRYRWKRGTYGLPKYTM